MDTLTNQVSSWIQGRESTFINGLREGGQIDDAVIEQLLELAIWAPNHGLTQPWHFKVFAQDGVRQFFQAQKQIYKTTTPPEKYREIKYQKYDDKPSKVSHIIAVICRKSSAQRFPEQEDLVATACAVQNIYLSLTSFKIGGYLSTGDSCYTEPMRKFLKLQDNDIPIGFFILGIPDPGFHRPARTRIPATEKTEWIR